MELTTAALEQGEASIIAHTPARPGCALTSPCTLALRSGVAHGGPEEQAGEYQLSFVMKEGQTDFGAGDVSAVASQLIRATRRRRYTASRCHT